MDGMNVDRELITDMADRLARIEQILEGIGSKAALEKYKRYYSTNEVAERMGVAQYTVQQRWCNEGRIACEKDAYSGKWMIPGSELQRLENGGGLRPTREAEAEHVSIGEKNRTNQESTLRSK